MPWIPKAVGALPRLWRRPSGVCATVLTPLRLKVKLGLRFRRDLADPGLAHGSAYEKEITMRIPFKLPTRMPLLRIAGVCIGLFAASGVVAIVRSIPVSYASVAAVRAPSEHRALASVPTDAYLKDSRPDLAGAQATINRQNRASCPECGVVDSVRRIERSGGAGRQDTLDVKVVARGSGGAIASSAVGEKSYEVTIRFRDGSTMVLNEVGPRTWRLGTRVIVIGRASSSTWAD